MDKWRIRVFEIVLGGVLYIQGGAGFDAGGGLSFDNSFGAVYLLAWLVGIVLLAHGIFSLIGKHI